MRNVGISSDVRYVGRIVMTYIAVAVVGYTKGK